MSDTPLYWSGTGDDTRQDYFPAPRGVVAAALGLLAPDRTLQKFDDETGEWFCIQPHPRVSLDILADDDVARHRVELVHMIESTVTGIAHDPHDREGFLQILALYLTQYVDHLDFVYHASSLLSVEENVLTSGYIPPMPLFFEFQADG